LAARGAGTATLDTRQKKREAKMSGTRRDFLRRVAQAGGYRATYLTMQAMGLLGTTAVAEPLVLERGTRHGTKVIVLGAGMAGLSAA
jgi:monoamine oxidase